MNHYEKPVHESQLHGNTHNERSAGEQSAANSARKKKIAGGVITGVGAATVVGGLIWYFAEPRSAATTGSLLKPNVTPAVTPGFAGLALSGAF